MDLTINKKRIFKALEDLPDDATIEDAQYRLHVLEQVSKSLVNTEKKIPQEEIEREFLSDKE